MHWVQAAHTTRIHLRPKWHLVIVPMNASIGNRFDLCVRKVFYYSLTKLDQNITHNILPAK